MRCATSWGRKVGLVCGGREGGGCEEDEQRLVERFDREVRISTSKSNRKPPECAARVSRCKAQARSQSNLSETSSTGNGGNAKWPPS